MLVAVQYHQTEGRRPGGLQRISKTTHERQEMGKSRSATPQNEKKKRDEGRIDSLPPQECPARGTKIVEINQKASLTKEANQHENG